mmetsp:Transcript_66103/g.149218  ORF Transcript_66103/g.149218 Transcript_66103/m.149218 type:complete len:267 (+) Transcript_66103:192-992(+)
MNRVLAALRRHRPRTHLDGSEGFGKVFVGHPEAPVVLTDPVKPDSFRHILSPFPKFRLVAPISVPLDFIAPGVSKFDESDVGRGLDGTQERVGVPLHQTVVPRLFNFVPIDSRRHDEVRFVVLFEDLEEVVVLGRGGLLLRAGLLQVQVRKVPALGKTPAALIQAHQCLGPDTVRFTGPVILLLAARQYHPGQVNEPAVQGAEAPSEFGHGLLNEEDVELVAVGLREEGPGRGFPPLARAARDERVDLDLDEALLVAVVEAENVAA